MTGSTGPSPSSSSARPTTVDETRRRINIGRSLAQKSQRSWRRQAASFAGTWALATLVLAITIGLTPGISAHGLANIAVAAVLVTLVGAVLRPALVRIAIAVGWVGIFLLGLFSQAIVMYVALQLSPGIQVDGFWPVFLASWIFALAITVTGWLDQVDADDVFLGHIVRQSLRRQKGSPVDRTDVPGVVFVQMDGVPLPLLRWALLTGNLPTLNRWVRGGSHTVSAWTARVPSTTPVSQAGILHGTNDDMPAFRWYEKDSGRLIVANHPPDAADIERRISDGRGLLADGGASISNLFTGDAPVHALTMSGIGTSRRTGLGDSADYAAFFSYPYGFARALLLTVGEMFKEIFQARRQVKFGIEPRVRRHGSYIALRGVTNVLLRDLNVALVVEQMMRGTNSIYVDFLDYDEIAHHAGIARPESLGAMQGIDGVLRKLSVVADQAPRPYHFVVVSDHGQSQGATFLQRQGQPLEDYVRDLMGGASLAAATANDEDWGPLNTFLSQLTQQSSVSGRVTKAVLRRRTSEGTVSLGPTQPQRDQAGERPELVVCGSGNLGLVWFAREAGRVTLEQVESRWPGLVNALATNPYMGFVVVLSESGLVALGRDGVRNLDTGEVSGSDPLEPYGEQGVEDMRRCGHFSNAPDIYLNSMFDEATQEVAAFEELVGCHGGLGGWQTEPILVHPAEWVVDEPLIGADAVHRQLVRWLEKLGQRTSFPGDHAVLVDRRPS